jgi:hypothetical protein
MKKVQTLNEEIQKMRKLMSFNINENSHDSLSEQNFVDSTEGENTNPLQKECGKTYSGPKQIAFEMSNQINVFLQNKVDYFERQRKIKIKASSADLKMGIKPTIIFEDGNDGTFEQERRGQYAFDISGQKIEFAQEFPVSSIREEFLNTDKCFRMVYDKYDAIKHQIDNAVIKMELYPQSGSRNIRMEMLIYNGDRKLKRSFRKGTTKLLDKNNLNIYDLNNPFFIDLGDKLYGYINCEFRAVLTNIKLDGGNMPTSWSEIEPDPKKCVCNDVETGEQITYPCGDPLPERCKRGNDIVFDFAVDASKNFEKDQAILTQDAKDIIDDKIVRRWNSIPQYRKDEYLEFLRGKTVTVNAYASIDALSNFPDGGRYAGCSRYGVGKGPRVDYNQCLSEARANAVVAHLKTIANEAFKNVNFEAVGKGETNEWSGLVWDQSRIPLTKDVKSPYSEEELKSDRRFEVKFPLYHKDN